MANKLETRLLELTSDMVAQAAPGAAGAIEAAGAAADAAAKSITEAAAIDVPFKEEEAARAAGRAKKLAEMGDAILSVAVCKPNGELIAGVNHNYPHEALSLGKLAIILASHRLNINPEEIVIIKENDVRQGGPLFHFCGEQIKIAETIAEALLVSGNTGPQVLTGACGGPGKVNSTLGREFKVTGLRLPDGTKHFVNPTQRYTHGLTTAYEAARLFAELIDEDKSAARLLALSNDTYGLRAGIDHRWDSEHHPANVLMGQLEARAESGDAEPLGNLLESILHPQWEPSQFPGKAGFDDDPDTWISAWHDVAMINGLVVATLTTRPYDPYDLGFKPGIDHHAHKFHAEVGKLIANA